MNIFKEYINLRENNAPNHIIIKIQSEDDQFYDEYSLDISKELYDEYSGIKLLPYADIVNKFFITNKIYLNPQGGVAIKYSISLTNKLNTYCISGFKTDTTKEFIKSKVGELIKMTYIDFYKEKSDETSFSLHLDRDLINLFDLKPSDFERCVRVGDYYKLYANSGYKITFENCCKFKEKFPNLFIKDLYKS